MILILFNEEGSARVVGVASTLSVAKMMVKRDFKKMIREAALEDLKLGKYDDSKGDVDVGDTMIYQGMIEGTAMCGGIDVVEDDDHAQPTTMTYEFYKVRLTSK